MTIELSMLYCPTCAGEQWAEAPPCLDGHGEDCPDRACTQCGTALMLDVPLFELLNAPVVRRPRKRRVAAMEARVEASPQPSRSRSVA